MKTIYKDGKWWIVKDDKVITILGGFDDPITPQLIIKEIESDGEI